jgi:hypothetical protein
MKLNANRLLGLRNKAKIYDLIESIGDLSVAQIIEATGFSERAVHNYINALKAERKIYVSEWSHYGGTGGGWCPYYSAGDQPTARKPDLKTRKNLRLYAKYKHRKRVIVLGGPANPFATIQAQLIDRISPNDLN